MNSQIIGQKIIELDSVDSTNYYGISLLNKGKIDEGTVIFARSQTSGHGLNGNFWESEKNKNITVSIVIYPTFLPLRYNFMLNIFTSLAIHDFVKSKIGHQYTHIKWPNDVYIHQKKVAGILIKNAIRGTVFEYSLLGLGVNINQLEFKSDAPNPVSIRNITNTTYNIRESLEELCLNFDQRYAQLRKSAYNQLSSDYHERLLFQHVFRKYKYKDIFIIAKILGVTREGKLLLEKDDGKRISCDIKEIEYVFD